MPVVAVVQFRDLDTALSQLERGFGSGDVEAIAAGIGEHDKVKLEFPGLAQNSGFFGRDQAAYLLDGLFNKVKPRGFERVSAKGAEGQQTIKARWTNDLGDYDLYITLGQKDGGWSLVSIRSAGCVAGRRARQRSAEA